MLRDAGENTCVPLHVAFNPYFPDAKDATEVCCGPLQSVADIARVHKPLNVHYPKTLNTKVKCARGVWFFSRWLRQYHALAML